MLTLYHHTEHNLYAIDPNVLKVYLALLTKKLYILLYYK